MSGAILVAVDGSDNAARALEFALALAQGLGVRVELLNVQPQMSGTVSMFVAKTELDAYRRDEGMKALAPSIAAAGQAGVQHDHHIGVGAPGPTIAGFAKQLGCAQIVMGTRGLGGALATLLGSVASATIRESAVPVTLVK